MQLPVPTSADVDKLARDLGFRLAPADAEAYAVAIAGVIPAHAAVSAFAAEHQPADPGQGRSHRIPAAGENPLNAWAVRTCIRKRQDGRLAGRRLAVKDSVMVAGIPMSNGSNLLEGFVPSMDAEVIRRTLAEGVEIVGKSTCE